MTYHDYYDPRRCVRTSDRKLILNFSTSPFFSDPSQEWFRTCIPVSPDRPMLAYHPPVELYNLKEDPLEQNNLAELLSCQDEKAHLLHLLFTWMKETRDSILQGIPLSPAHVKAIELLESS
ncbi:MAG: hypothetical protein HQ557_06865 [Bacteroidetes bacterium]|nr:hypothetical protein [Bacteroidota bacterium]